MPDLFASSQFRLKPFGDISGVPLVKANGSIFLAPTQSAIEAYNFYKSNQLKRGFKMNSPLTKETLQQYLASATGDLLALARDSAWNKISDNCLYIISESKDSDRNLWEDALFIKRINDKKNPASLTQLMPALLDLYSTMYDINLFVYRSFKNLTIVDIQYCSKNSLDEDYRKTVEDNAPMLHCKVPIPFYCSVFNTNEKRKKFDINWEHNPFSHRWKAFWARFTFKFITAPLYNARLRRQRRLRTPNRES